MNCPELPLESNTYRADINFTLEQGAVLSGRVLSANGSLPIEGAEVSVFAEDAEDAYFTDTQWPTWRVLDC